MSNVKPEHLEFSNPDPGLLCAALEALFGSLDFKVVSRSSSGTWMAVIGHRLVMEIRRGTVAAGSTIAIRCRKGRGSSEGCPRQDFLDALRGLAVNYPVVCGSDWEQKAENAWVLPFVVCGQPFHGVYRGDVIEVVNWPALNIADLQAQEHQVIEAAG